MLKRVWGLLLVFVLVASSASSAVAWAPSKILVAATRMYELGILRGRLNAGMAYQEDLTRAEAVTILVRALGREEAAQQVTYPAFSDTADHWANGYIAIGKSLVSTYRQTLGYPDGTFHPDDPITAFEIVALVLKFLGVTPQPGYDWPDNYYQAGIRTGVIDEGERFCGGEPRSAPAIRGCIIQYADRAFSLIPINLEGQTVYERYHNLTVNHFTVHRAKNGDYFQVTNSKILLDGVVDVTGTIQVSVNDGKFRTVESSPRGDWEHVVSLRRGQNTVTFKISLPNNREETFTLTLDYERS